MTGTVNVCSLPLLSVKYCKICVRYHTGVSGTVKSVSSTTLECQVRHSPETEGNVLSALVLYKQFPEYSQLTDDTYLYFYFIRIQTIVFFPDFQNVFLSHMFSLKKLSPMKNDQYLYTSKHTIRCLTLLCLYPCSKVDHFTHKKDFHTLENYAGCLLQKSCFLNTLELALIFLMSDA